MDLLNFLMISMMELVFFFLSFFLSFFLFFQILISEESACNMETWVESLGWEDPLEKRKATHSSILA